VLHERDAGIHDRGELQRLTGVMIAHFLTAYRSELATAHASEMFDDALVRAFRYRQVCREYIYAVTHLPRWLYVPDGALPALVAEYDG
jgi:maltokinase